MELKRILARDTRSATDKAIALYGPDVLVISNHQVDGQTELVVALDVAPEAPAPAAAPAAAATTNFRETFVQAQQQAPATQVTATPSPTAQVPAAQIPTAQASATQFPAAQVPARPAPAPGPAVLPQAIPAALLRPQVEVLPLATQGAAAPVAATPVAAAPVAATPAASAPTATGPAGEEVQSQARDMQRSRELVDLVRQEIAALRREFRLSQQTSAWQQGLQIHPALAKLVEALHDSPVPAALRALLMDELQDQSDPQQVLGRWRDLLQHNLQRRPQELPTTGVHVLAGPSGAGKSLMCARLARHASGLHGVEGVALISYRDQRAGAWSQIQMLGAQLGIDCFRAPDAQALGMLLDELGTRRLVLIDTPGVQMAERLAELRGAAPKARMHAVVSADASAVTLRKVLLEADQAWTSVMLSKLDEAHAPWPLLQLFSDNELELSCASDGSQVSNLMQTFTVPQLIDLALAPLARAIEFSAVMAPVAPQPAAKPAAAPVAKPKTVRRSSRSAKTAAAGASA